MIINTVLLDKKRYKLVDDDYCSKNNAFTIIVGSNGKGKSRLLKRIVNNVKNVTYDGEKIPRNYTRQIDFDIDGYKSCFYSPISESKSYISKDKIEILRLDSDVNVLAVTTTPFDKFPVEYKGNELFRYSDNHRYTYIGLKVSKNSLNQSNYLNLLARSLLTSDKIFENERLFELLKLLPHAKIQFKSKLPVRESDLISYNYKTKKFDKSKLDFRLFLSRVSVHHSTIFEKIKKEEQSEHVFESYIKCYYLLENPIDPTRKDIPKKELLYLLDIGLINVSDVIFIDDKRLEELKSSDLSSGQKCMILTLLNIAGSITDNSVVCIDEPEISLHPKWQREFMRVLIEFFSGYKRCHFIIATHSPLIISELSNENCHILNMDDGYAKKSEKYTNMSSDYQLAEVFGIAGNNNEYLNRIVVSLLSKLSVERDLDQEDRLKLKTLIKLSKEMEDGDNVKELINILNFAWSKVSKNVK